MRRLLATSVVVLACCLAPVAAGATLQPVVNIWAGLPAVPASGQAVSIRATTTGPGTCLWSVKPSLRGFATAIKCSPKMARVAHIPPSTRSTRTRYVFTIQVIDGRISLTDRAVVLEAAAAGPAVPTAPTTTTPSSPAAPSPTTTLAPTYVRNPDWSGYVVPSINTLITDASASWTVPTLNCTDTPNGGASIWVGIGGYTWPTGGTSGTLLQTGVNVDCVNGSQQDSGWWEMYPSSPNEDREFTNFPVSPGDSITSSVYEDSNGAWDTRVDDHTTGLSGWMVTGGGWGVSADSSNGTFKDQGTTFALTYAGGYTGEWIVEDYTLSGTQVPFVAYGTVSFSNLETSLSSWNLTPSDGLELVQNSTVLSAPSPVSGDGFSVSYTGP